MIIDKINHFFNEKSPGRHTLKQLIFIVVSFCIHFFLVKFGSLFTIPFGFASLIWPVTGVMLGLYLIFGPSILIGSLLSSLLVIDQQSVISFIPNYAVVILAFTSVFQFIISKYLVLRFFKLPVKIHFPSEIIKFLLLTGPLSTFITSSIFAITLWVYLKLNTELLFYIWAAKWIGDFISIVFITPIILFLGENDFVPKAKRPFAAISTSLFVLSVISFIYILNSYNTFQEKEQQFINSTQPFVEHMNVAHSTIKNHLTALNGFFQASETVTREEFKIFTNKIYQSDIKIRALAWLPLVNDRDRVEFEEGLVKEGFNQKIKTLTEQGFQSSLKQDDYIPIFYTEPLKENSSAIGLDVSTHPPVIKSVNKAINEKKHIITPLLSLVQQQDKYTGVIVYSPIYKAKTPTEVEKFQGLVEAVFELDVLALHVHQKINASNFTYQLSYGDNNVLEHPLYNSQGMFNHKIKISIFDKSGSLTFSSTKSFELGLIDWTGLILILVGCVIGIISVMLVFLIISFNYSLKKKVKENTAKLIKNNDELIRANKAKNLFLANISHEYRTPLNAIIGFTEIAKRETKDQNAIDYLTKIDHSSNILLNIVNDVLDISKMQAGELNLESRSFNPSIEILSVIDMLTEKANEKSITITKSLHQNFNTWVAGDDFRFKQILINLLNNAIKFTKNGEININGHCQNTESTRILTFTVLDTGIGINKEQQINIFSAFAQAESSTTRKYGGTGLGLSIVKQLCTLMNGDITLTSQYGKGSEFTVTLELPQAQKPVKLSAYKEEKLQQSNFEGINLLVVEDNKINQTIVQKQLESLGVSCDLVDDGQEALNYLEHQIPELILMDLQMPTMDGFTASSIIKKNDKLKNIPIIILSASVGKEDKERAEELGIEDFIHKPFQQADLKYVLNKYLT